MHLRFDTFTGNGTGFLVATTPLFWLTSNPASQPLGLFISIHRLT